MVGLERDLERLRMLQSGKLPFAEPGLELEMAAELASGRLVFHGFDYRSERPAVLVVATPTPTLPSGESDISSVESMLSRFWDADRHALVIVRSTLLPGTMESIAAASGSVELADRLVHWPEFLNQGKALQEFRRPDRVVIGADSDRAGAGALDLIRSFAIATTRWERVSLRQAEAVKHFSNAALAVNQALGAEIARVCEDIGVDSDGVLACVSADSRLNADLLRPRVPLVDSCLAKDLAALTERLSLEGGPSILSTSLKQAELLHVDATQRLARHVKAAGDRVKILLIGAGFASE